MAPRAGSPTHLIQGRQNKVFGKNCWFWVCSMMYRFGSVLCALPAQVSYSLRFRNEVITVSHKHSEYFSNSILKALGCQQSCYRVPEMWQFFQHDLQVDTKTGISFQVLRNIKKTAAKKGYDTQSVAMFLTSFPCAQEK